MAKSMKAYSGKSAGKRISLSAGLTDSDRAGLQVVEDHTQEVVGALGTAIVAALEEVGLVAEGYAKKLCPVDTGRLRNSITHTIDVDGKWAMIGTNVEYAPVVELGRLTGKYEGANDGRGFLRPAATDHVNTYRKIIEKHLRDA